ncbi:RidA family protein [Erysipelothrix inopinata]|uniref:RidA family protein n=1 Tax=Erysipelothrix inopinata TaxID=225084 RepID=A0A7G9S1G6_9FIRM|nr:RidA family protein [Erysipelothrix inopinata]QNN61691.1 RidA family protein [Erysipelothrix inopinata]
MKKVHNTDKAPKAIGPYVQAVEANGFIFTSGQLGLNPETGTLQEGIEAQAHQVMKNLQSVLENAGSDFSKVVKTTILLSDIADFATVNEIYGSYFGGEFPARSAYQVATLPLGGLIEIELIALA